MPEILDFTNRENGVPFRVLYVPGMGNAVEPGVRFYDARYPHDRGLKAQFTGASYYVSTLMEDRDRLSRYGLNLHGGVDDWAVDAASMREVFTWLDSIAKED